jgi:predicted transcriptional regulator
MKDGKALTLAKIEAITGDPQASISAQLRHLRKKKYGSHAVERISLGGGLHTYKLTVNEAAK